MTLSNSLQNVLDKAFSLAKKSHHEFVTPEHILFVALELDAIKGLFLFCGVDSSYIQELAKEYLDKKIPTAEEIDPIQTEGFQNLLERSIMHCISAEKSSVELTDVLVSMFDDKRLHCCYFLEKANLSKLQFLEVLSYVQNQAGDIPTTIEGENIDDNNYEKSKAQPNKTSEKKSVLGFFTKNMIEEANKGSYENLIGRESEINRLVEVLCRKTKNNPILIGDSGVGKTAIVQGLAIKINNKDVPAFLEDFKIFSLDVATLLAGAKFRGDFEERIKQITLELSRQKKVALFIDETHWIMGNGNGAGNVDGSNLLKTLLSNEKIRVIGTTTHEEFSKTLEKDNALCRRFQKIEVKEPSQDETVKILLGIKKSFEDFHKVEFTEEAIKSAVDLSSKYMSERRFPDKAIDVLDEAGAYAFIHQKQEKIYKTDIEKVVAKIAKVPIEAVTSNQKDKLQNLEKELNSKVFGQNRAISEIVKSVKRSRAGFCTKEKPASIFLFVGAS